MPAGELGLIPKKQFFQKTLSHSSFSGNSMPCSGCTAWSKAQVNNLSHFCKAIYSLKIKPQLCAMHFLHEIFEDVVLLFLFHTFCSVSVIDSKQLNVFLARINFYYRAQHKLSRAFPQNLIISSFIFCLKIKKII